MLNLNRRTISLILLLTIWFGLSMLYGKFAGGKGSDEDPYLVRTAEQLNEIRFYPQSCFKQIADIDLGIAPWNEAEGWLPIDVEGGKKYGNYDGGNFVIKGLYINRPDTDNVGLFGKMSKWSIVSVNLLDVNVTGGNNTGALVGIFNPNQTEGFQTFLENCSVFGRVKGKSNVGGMIGSFKNVISTTNCSKVEVIATSEQEANAGGLFGYIENAKIYRSYSRKSVTAINNGSNVGGFVGFAESPDNFFIESYSTGKVSGGENVGGFVGFATYPRLNSKTIWDIESSGVDSSFLAVGMTTEQMTYPYGEDVYEKWNFTTCWTHDTTHLANDGYPYFFVEMRRVPSPPHKPFPENGDMNVMLPTKLKWDYQLGPLNDNLPSGYVLSFGTNNPPKNLIDRKPIGNVTEYELSFELKHDTQYYWRIMPYNKFGVQEDTPIWTFKTSTLGGQYFAGGEGIESAPWRIETAKHLDNIRLFSNDRNYFVLTSDIDLSESNVDYSPEYWIPIGTTTENSFNGVFEGNEHTINRLNVNSTNGKAGLFGYLSEATIKNLKLTNVNIVGDTHVGGLAGLCEKNTNISYCSVSGSVKGNSSVGGLVGKNLESTIIACSNRANVSGNSYVGGVTGRNQNSKISNSYNMGNVKGSERVGGLVGYCNFSKIHNCYSAGKVEGSEFVGGFVGTYSHNGSEDINNYWNTEVSGQTISPAGKPRNTEEMTFPYSYDTYVGWDFNRLWIADEDHSFNKGYPYLKQEIIVSVENIPVIDNTTLTNYPNPFNPETTITFNITKPSKVELVIYNIKGELIKTLFSGHAERGIHRVTWDGKDEYNNLSSSGVYLYKLVTPEKIFANKMILIK